jgi:hypothetical protein
LWDVVFWKKKVHEGVGGDDFASEVEPEDKEQQHQVEKGPSVRGEKSEGMCSHPLHPRCGSSETETSNYHTEERGEYMD